MCKASKRENIQKKRENLDYRLRENRLRSAGLDCDNDMEQREKFKNRKTSKREFMKKKRTQAVNKVKDDHNRLKLSEEDKTEKRKASKREFMQKKRQNADYRQQENRMRSASLNCDTDMEQRQKIDNRKTSKREFM